MRATHRSNRRDFASKDGFVSVPLAPLLAACHVSDGSVLDAQISRKEVAKAAFLAPFYTENSK